MPGIFWMLKLFAGLLILLITIGLASTKFLISDGLDRFKGRDLEFARDALMRAYIGCADHPVASVMMWKIKVVDVEFNPHCPSAKLPDYVDYRAVLKTYTLLFGIPTGKITMNCGLVICNY